MAKKAKAKKRTAKKVASRAARGYNRWTSADLKALRRHSKARTPVAQVAKQMGRSEATIRMKAYSLDLSMGHRRRGAKKKARG